MQDQSPLDSAAETLGPLLLAVVRSGRGPALEAWLDGLERNTEIDGAPVFPGTRLTVHHVGETLVERCNAPETRAELQAEHSHLTEDDLDFSLLLALVWRQAEGGGFVARDDPDREARIRIGVDAIDLGDGRQFLQVLPVEAKVRG